NVSGGSSRAMFFVGFGYSVYTLLMLVGLYRFAVPTIRSARWIPFAIATIDFTFVTVQGVLGSEFRGFGNLGTMAIGTVIPLSFSVARSPSYHLLYAVALAEASFLVVAGYIGALSDQLPAVVFICGGLLVLGLMLAMTNVAVKNMFAGLRKRDNLTRFLPRQVVDRVLAMGPEALAPVEREVTVMFSDIRGFTGMSEGLEPRDVLMMLDDYFGRMSQIVKGHDGVVGKFLGDGMLAFWGVPDRLDDHAVRAVRAARDMRRALRELNDHRAKSGQPPIRIGIGIHTGPVAAGMLGGALQAEYTIIGDAVNVASRIEGLTKDHHVDVLVSETTWAQLPVTRRGDKLATAEIRGRKEAVTVYTLDASAPSVEISQA
ncbi:MAG TPA: adenylate/guanylate cyclase domain-containing protein, partial [Kofleriaceae bacterium]|nr:adenylate/guanylate cyclase domain-containing protein [Kofleriaceae bacterium]